MFWKIRWGVLAILLALALGLWILWGNISSVVTQYTIHSPALPGAFKGFRIAQISDLHNAKFGKENRHLLSLLAREAPDLIVFTGDILDSRRTNLPVTLDFVRSACEIAPCYYVSGNHEARLPDYPSFEAALEELGVTVLNNRAAQIRRDQETITLLGIRDYDFVPDQSPSDALNDALADATKGISGFSVLLAHRPEWIESYAAYPIQLVLSGHAHGGQFRIPFLGGLFTPSQGFFPEYDAGVYCREETQMVVSRGLGNSLFPFRLNNRPEIVLITLEAS